MRKTFSEYYCPTQAEYKKLLTEALVVVDANILLAAYRLPKLGRDALLETLEKLRGRLWIPHQVGLEFQANRLTVVSAEIRKLNSVIREGKKALSKIRSDVEGMELDRRGVDVDDATLKSSLDAAERELEKIVEQASTGEPEISLIDLIRDRLDAIFEGRVGPPPADQQSMDELGVVAQRRYESKIPPGFKDESKDDASDLPARYSRGIRVERKYGDYILWRQTLDYVKDCASSAVLFVTSDSKDDWWQEVGGRTLGPLPALIAEMQAEAGCPLFWMYNLTQFLDQANEHLHANISPKALQEVKESEVRDVFSSLEARTSELNAYKMFSQRKVAEHRAIEAMVARWYEGQGFLVATSDPPYELIIQKMIGRTVGVKIYHWKPEMVPVEEDFNSLWAAARIAIGQAGYRGIEEVELVVIVPLLTSGLLSMPDMVAKFKQSIAYIIAQSGLRVIRFGFVADGQFRTISPSEKDPEE